ncbi:phosphoglucosamine mutase [Helicobacter kayseriensis]|uniref:phosphoglucosamine mutase n=1 Tax=Helicobacter kayseriensis TaxID=2905877 RepID=UPI001E647797|nr:phosphoglucosamine mutase [Helicobacter kayseriensis]MCE3046612.1 phosphoglucosamine mutase [Helicobacter kayseriensis]MCE3048086.1 phosphoglucosamine mutase [Helicobacter kayseriensis]
MKIFGTDGVRGKAGVEITAIKVLRLGIAAGIFFRKHSITNKILVGKDTRRSGYMIENALVSALTSVGYDVIQVGPMPTPAIAFLTEDMRCDGGIMISASHNPYEDNGIKFFDRFGFKLDRDAEKEIEEILLDGERLEKEFKSGKEIGSSKRIDDVLGRYIVHIKNSFPKDLNLQGVRIALDVSNGASYKVAPMIFQELGAEVIVIHDEPNGFNINEKCGALYPQELANAVKEYRADVGFAFDGDADRLVVVDEKGNVVDGDKILGALALYQKENDFLSSSKIIATSMSNLALEEFLKSKGLELVRSDVGDKYVLEEMQKHNANFGGEQSGHIIFSSFAKTGDGITSALQVMAMIKRSYKPASQVLSPFSLYPSQLTNLNVASKKDLMTLEGYHKLLQEIESEGMRHLIRYSGTENKLRILLEGKDQEKILKKMQVLVEFFENALGAV